MGQSVIDEAPTGLTEAHLRDPLTLSLGLPTDLAPASKPDYPSNEAGHALHDLDRYETALAEARRRVEEAIASKEEMLTHAGDPHAAKPAALRQEANESFDRIAQSLASERGGLETIAEQLARHPGAEMIESLETAAGMSAKTAREASERIAPAKEDLIRKLTEAVTAAASAYFDYEQRREAAKRDYLSLRARASEALADLVTWDVQPTASGLSSRFTTVDAKPEADWFDAKEKMEALAVDIGRARQAHVIEYAETQGKLSIALGNLESMMSTLADVVDAKVIQAFRDRIAIAREMGNTGRNLHALDAAIERCAAIAKDAQDLLDTEPEGLIDIETKRAAIAKKLEKDAKAKKLRPKDHAAMKAEADALANAWFKMPMSRALAAYTELESKVVSGAGWTSFNGRAETQRVWAEVTMTQKLKAAKTAVDALDTVARADPGTGSRKYEGALRKAVDALPAKIEAEQSQESMSAIAEEADRIAREARKWAGLTASDFTSGSALALGFHQDQAAGIAAREETETAIREFETAYEQLMQTYNACSGEAAVKADKAEYKAIKVQLNGARTTATKTKDPVTAMALLERAKDRLTELRNGGPEIRRGKLGEIHTAWLSAVSAFEEKCDALIEAVAQETADTDYAGAEANLRDALAPAREFLGTISFAEEAVELAGSDKSKKADRKRARESVLTKIRQANAALTGNTAVKMAVANPFKIAAVATQIHKTLREIEFEVLRGV